MQAAAVVVSRDLEAPKGIGTTTQDSPSPWSKYPKTSCRVQIARGYLARKSMAQRMHLHRQATKIQLLARRMAARAELKERARRRRVIAFLEIPTNYA